MTGAGASTGRSGGATLGARLRAWGPAALLALVAVALHIDVVDRVAAEDQSSEALLQEAHALIGRRWIGGADRTDLTRRAIAGMTTALDPYSRFYTPEQARIFNEETQGKFGGLGIFIDLTEDGIVSVIAPLAGTPAADAGILPGDRFVLIDGEARRFGATNEAVDALKGDPGTTIRLTVESGTGAEASRREVTLTRSIIRVESVRGTRIVDEDAGIGFLRITAFQGDTFEEVVQALLTLKKAGARAVVIDLRMNPGGLLDTATDIADLFLDKERLIVTTRTVDRTIEKTRASRECAVPGMPIAVLIDGGSASAAEVLAGALRDQGKAVLVGSRSFGKGSVQSLITLLDGQSMLKLTTAWYYTPSGRRIHRPEKAKLEDEWGLLPDFVVELSREEQLRLAERQSERYIASLKRRSREGRDGSDDSSGAKPPPDKMPEDKTPAEKTPADKTPEDGATDAPETPVKTDLELDRGLGTAVRHLREVLDGRAALIPGGGAGAMKPADGSKRASTGSDK